MKKVLLTESKKAYNTNIFYYLLIECPSKTMSNKIIVELLQTILEKFIH